MNKENKSLGEVISLTNAEGPVYLKGTSKMVPCKLKVQVTFKMVSCKLKVQVTVHTAYIFYSNLNI